MYVTKLKSLIKDPIRDLSIYKSYGCLFKAIKSPIGSQLSWIKRTNIRSPFYWNSFRAQNLISLKSLFEEFVGGYKTNAQRRLGIKMKPSDDISVFLRNW